MHKLDTGMRVLRVRRISRDTESSSSLDRQQEQQTEALKGTGCIVVDDVVDATVSGKINLDDRPKLGRWMKDPLWHEWDAIMVTSLDRITRNQAHWEAFAERCHQGGKEIVCLDDPALDIHTGVGRVVAYIKASQAQAYREAISEKRINQNVSFRAARLWAGGTWPFGYRPERISHEGKERFKLFLDPVTSELVREAYGRIINDEWSLGKIARDWNARGVLTPKDYQRSETAISKGLTPETRGSKWSSSNLGAILKKPAVKGLAMHNGETFKEHGMDFRWADPILTDEEFDRLQDALQNMGKNRSGIRGNTNPISGLALCPCSCRLYPEVRNNARKDGTTKAYHVFRCGSRILNGTSCGFQPTWPQDVVLNELEERFLKGYGETEMIERTWVPGKNNRKRIEELKASISNLTTAIGQASSAAVISSLVAAQESNSGELVKLEKEPFVPGYWKEVGTGKTYGEMWVGLQGWQERGPFLRRAGFRILPAKYDGEAFFAVIGDMTSDPAAADSENQFDSKEYDKAVHAACLKMMGAPDGIAESVEDLRALPLLKQAEQTA